MPREYISEAIADGFKDTNIEDARILLPRSAEARPVLVSSLRNLGALVDEIAIYTTAVPAEKDTAGKRMLLNGEIDIITFTSSSTVRNLASMIGGEILYVNNTMVACIGPITATTATDMGIRVDIVAEEHTIDGLVQAIMDHYEDM
jgi:uroporphyrinogen-III synthase